MPTKKKQHDLNQFPVATGWFFGLPTKGTLSFPETSQNFLTVPTFHAAYLASDIRIRDRSIIEQQDDSIFIGKHDSKVSFRNTWMCFLVSDREKKPTKHKYSPCPTALV